MKKIQLTLILVTALWTALPADSPFRLLLELVGSDVPFGDVVPTGDPDTDPIMINMPPPR